MPCEREITQAPRKVRKIFFLVNAPVRECDAALLNCAIEYAWDYIRQMQTYDLYTDHHVACMEYGNSCIWRCPATSVDDAQWCEFAVGTEAKLSCALKELAEQLDRQKMMAADGPILSPIVIFVGTGTQVPINWEPELSQLKQNKWYAASNKAALAFDKWQHSVFCDLLEAVDNVFDVPDLSSLGNVLVEVLRATMEEVVIKEDLLPDARWFCD